VTVNILIPKERIVYNVREGATMDKANFDKQLKLKLIRLIKEYLHKFANEADILHIAVICRIDVGEVKSKLQGR
jgi:hypothetical protein